MSDSARDLLERVMTELEALQGPIPSNFGKLEDLAQADYPTIRWTFGTIAHVLPRDVGGNDGSLYDEWQLVSVAIWQDTPDNARITKNNLLRASRNIASPADFQPGDFNWATEDDAAFLNRGALLVGTLRFRLPIPNEAGPLVTVLTEDHEASVNGEVVKPLGA